MKTVGLTSRHRLFVYCCECQNAYPEDEPSTRKSAHIYSLLEWRCHWEVEWGKVYSLLHAHKVKGWGSVPPDISIPRGSTRLHGVVN
jgi:hypothetical protein